MTMSIADIETYLQAQGDLLVATLGVTDLAVVLVTETIYFDPLTSDPLTDVLRLNLTIGEKNMVWFEYKDSFASINSNPFKDCLNNIPLYVADDDAFLFEVRQALGSDRVEPFLSALSVL